MNSRVVRSTKEEGGSLILLKQSFWYLSINKGFRHGRLFEHCFFTLFSLVPIYSPASVSVMEEDRTRVRIR